MMSKTMARAIIVLFFFFLFGSAAALPADADEGSEKEVFMRAKVLDVQHLEQEELATGIVLEKTLLTLEILDGPFAGQVLDVENNSDGHPAYSLTFKPGDRVLVSGQTSDGELSYAYVADFARDRYLYGLVAAFLLTLTLVGGLVGIKALLTLGITGLAIGMVLLPLLLQGYSPIGVTVIVCAMVIAITFMVIAGLGRKTVAAIVGTTGGVVAAGLIALLVGTLARLTGFGGSEEALWLLYIPQEITLDIQGLLFAGIIIGALGAVMDVGMSVASAMEEIKRANPRITRGELFRSGLNVGRDTMGTMANTLILAYTGATIPLMLIFMAYEVPYLKIINLDMIATEIIRAMAGSIGLVLAVPITALVAGLLMTAHSKPARLENNLHE